VDGVLFEVARNDLEVEKNYWSFCAISAERKNLSVQNKRAVAQS
jgi:hypothetical protein